MKMCEIPAFSLSGYFCALKNHLQSDGAELCTSKQLWIKRHLDFQILWIKEQFVTILLFCGSVWKHYSIQNGTAHIYSINICLNVSLFSREMVWPCFNQMDLQNNSCEVVDHSQLLSLKIKLIPVLKGLSGNTKIIFGTDSFGLYIISPSTKL